MAENSKRKTWKSSSTSSTEESLSPDDKKLKHNISLTDSEPRSEPDEVLTLLNMAEAVMPKLEQVLEKLDKVESKLEKLEDYVKAVDKKVSDLRSKVERFESFRNETKKTIKDIEDGMNFANAERETFKKKLQEMKGQIYQLKDEKLYMGVYQRLKNLRFFGIKEENEEDTREVLVDFLKTELGIGDAEDLEFQRAHRIGKQSSPTGKPRQIIARFLRYPDREEVMSNARKLKGKDVGISPDLPKEILERRKKKMHQFKKAKQDGKTAFFSRAEPNKLFIDGVQI